MSNEITNALVAIKPARINKAGRQLKAVFGSWQGKALVTDSGRLVSRKELGVVQGLEKSALTAAYSEAVLEFNRLGEAKLAHEQSEIASGRREMKQMLHNPKTGRTTIVTVSANKAVKVSKILEEKGLDAESIESVLKALKIA